MKNETIQSTTDHVGTAALGCPVERTSTGMVKIHRLAEQLKLCAHVFLAAIREIFDESAYARFLTQRQLSSSRASYAAFRQEYEVTKARRPRCC
jgi:hypothetical protein